MRTLNRFGHTIAACLMANGWRSMPIRLGDLSAGCTSAHRIIQKLINTGIFALACPIGASGAFAATPHPPVPTNRPRPDGKPGDATRPVKADILAGQSNNKSN